MNQATHTNLIKFSHRLANFDDIAKIMSLMQSSIEVNMQAFLSSVEIEEAKLSMGVDKSLIEDQTYFVIETTKDSETIMIGCGGWGKRRTLYGGDHTKGRDDRFSDPAKEPARIRAMYTHPDWTRLGVGRYLLNLGEEAAKKAGFKTIELGSTLAGEPLYQKAGYQEVSREVQVNNDGIKNYIIKMVKLL